MPRGPCPSTPRNHPKSKLTRTIKTAKMMEDFNSETDSDYTSYWRDWVRWLRSHCKALDRCPADRWSVVIEPSISDVAHAVRGGRQHRIMAVLTGRTQHAGRQPTTCLSHRETAAGSIFPTDLLFGNSFMNVADLLPHDSVCLVPW